MHTDKTKGSEALQRLREAARQLGIECLDTEWLGVNAHYRLRCAQGHEYQRKPNAILTYGRGCPECRNHARLARLQAIAEQHGGRCLEARYLGNKALYRVICAKSHTWKVTGGAILQGTWCLQCARAQTGERNRLSDGLDRLRELARARGGECLSLRYDLSITYYHMRCAKGHEWRVIGARIFKGNWCRKCYISANRDSLESMQAIAAARGGSCLSTTYRNRNTKLTWLCHRGHSWSAIPGNVKKGHWCPTCSHMRKITNPKSKARIKYLKKG